jgi:hypothetical protein
MAAYMANTARDVQSCHGESVCYVADKSWWHKYRKNVTVKVHCVERIEECICGVLCSRPVSVLWASADNQTTQTVDRAMNPEYWVHKCRYYLVSDSWNSCECSVLITDCFNCFNCSVKPMGASVTICMRVLMILIISHPTILFFPCIWYFVGLCVAEVIMLCEWLWFCDSL